MTFTGAAAASDGTLAEGGAAAEDDGGELNVFSYKEPPRHVGEGAWRGLKVGGGGVVAGWRGGGGSVTWRHAFDSP